jgi:hypothetical protein
MKANTKKKEWLAPELELYEVDQTKGGVTTLGLEITAHRS